MTICGPDSIFFTNVRFFYTGELSTVEKRRQERVTTEHVSNLVNKTDVPTAWKEIAHRLVNLEQADEPGDAKFAFRYNVIDEIKEERKSDRECLRYVLNQWRGASSLHTVGYLYDLLREEGIQKGAGAEDVFGRLHWHTMRP